MQIYIHYRDLSDAQKESIGSNESKWLDNEASYNSYYFFEEDIFVACIFTRWKEPENTIHVMWAEIPATRHDIYPCFLKKLKTEGYDETTIVSFVGFYTQGHPELCNRINALFSFGFKMKNMAWGNLEMIRLTMETTLK